MGDNIKSTATWYKTLLSTKNMASILPDSVKYNQIRMRNLLDKSISNYLNVSKIAKSTKAQLAAYDSKITEEDLRLNLMTIYLGKSILNIIMFWIALCMWI